MRNYILEFKSWYEQRETRERALAMLLSWAVLYAFFYFFCFRQLDLQSDSLTEKITKTNHQIENWHTQITAINGIADSPLYKNWVQQQKEVKYLQDQYKFLLQTSATEQWQDVIKILMRAQSNIRLEEIKNFPESAYNPTNSKTIIEKIYQQKLLLVIYADYFDTMTYIKRLEQLLPYIHWESLDYQVMQYPIAKVELEFSILYEKNH